MGNIIDIHKNRIYIKKIILLMVLMLFNTSISIFSEEVNEVVIVKEPSNRYELTLESAQKQFVENNLLLLASRFEIEASRAKIIQARLYANPTISFDQGVHNDKTDRYLDFTRSGQTAIQIQQLFLLGGKIDKRVKVAEIQTKISEEMFYDILRALQYELKTSFYQLFFLRQSLSFYDLSINALRKTTEFADNAYKNRAILQAEVLRLKALLFFLENERTELVVQSRQKEASLRVLLNNPDMFNLEIYPQLEQGNLDKIEVNKITLKEALEVALENRPDLKVAVQSLKYEEANLELQKANAIPDLSFGPLYNRQGTAYPNYWGITAQITMPIFDRNQGNIEAAEKSIQVRRHELQNQRLQIENEISIVYNKALEKNRLYHDFKDKFTEDYKKLAGLMISNYEKRYVTIIEFADFFETYRSSIQQMIRLQTERMDAIEGVNYSVGKGILNQ